MKKIIRKCNVKMLACILLAVAIAWTGMPLPGLRSPATIAKAASPVVESAISWAVSIANDNSHGYSQRSRWGPDYDCSSLVISAFRHAGVNVGAATYTGNMRAQFTQHGFQWIPWAQIGGTSNLQRGDILLNEKTHTEIYLGGNQNVGAHSDRGYPQTGDQTGTEISVSGYYYHPWNGVLRYAGSDICRCSTDYAGEYCVSTSSLPLTMRGGHGTGYPSVASIPKGARVYVSRADGNWAHVEWNGRTGYCSMSYLTKITSRNYTLHAWMSDIGMGGTPSNFVQGKGYYLCYELIDTATGKKANETSNMSYSVTETIRNSTGKVFEHTYQNSDNNWIYQVCDTEDAYTGTVTVSGDVNISVSVSYDVYADTAPQIKAWAWEGDDSREISTIGVGKTAYCSYLVRDKHTGKNLNDATSFWTKGNGYTVTVKVYDPSGKLVKTQSYKNNDCTWFSFLADKIGEYKIVASVTGNLSGGYERTIKAEEKEHHYGSWKTTKQASCSQTGTRTRTCSICNKTQMETVPMTDHEIVKDSMIAATCTKEGRTAGEHCSVCGRVIVKQNKIPAVGHQYGRDWKANASYHWKECDCGEKDKATSHMYEWVTDQPATEMETGLKHQECSICGFGRKYNTLIDKIEARPTETPAATAEPTETPTVTDRPMAAPAATARPTETSAPVATIRPTSVATPAAKPTFAPEVTSNPANGSSALPASTTKPMGVPTASPDESSSPIIEPSLTIKQNHGKLGKVKIKILRRKKKGKVLVKWKNVKGRSGYQIQYSLKKDFSMRRTKHAGECRITLKGLRMGKKYYIRIRAYSLGRKCYYGKWSKVKHIKIR